MPRLRQILDGWYVLDDNLLACPEPHVRAVFAMLARQNRRAEFTGGLEALALQDYQVGLLADLKPRPNCFFVYDAGDPFETLRSAASRLALRHARTGCAVTFSSAVRWTLLQRQRAAARCSALCSLRMRCSGSRRRPARRNASPVRSGGDFSNGQGRQSSMPGNLRHKKPMVPLLPAVI